MVDGEWIMKDRNLMKVDENKIDSRYNQVVERFISYLKAKLY